MDLYQLKIFFAFGKVMNFSETANIMCLTQSAVSHSIKKLEESIDTKLVERKGKNSFLTVEGKELYKTCENIFCEIDKVTEKINQLKGNYVKKVTIGSPVEFGTTLLIKYLSNFSKNNQNIRINYLFSHHLEKPYLHDEVDFIIDCKNHKFENSVEIPLFLEHYVVIASPDYILEKNIKTVNDLKNALIFSIDESGSWWQKFLNVLPNSDIFKISNIITINHIRGIINSSIEGLGIGFVPYYTVVNELKNKILMNPFPKIKPEADNFSIYIKKERLNIEKNKVLINYLKSIEFDSF